MKDGTQVNALKNRCKHDALTDEKQRMFEKRGKGPKIDCGSCGRKHAKKECPAFGQTCRKCRKKNNFQAKCRSKKVSKVDEVSDDDDKFHISTVGEDSMTTRRANKAVVTLLVSKKNNERAVRFQVDTGSEYDVIPLALYKQVTGDN